MTPPPLAALKTPLALLALSLLLAGAGLLWSRHQAADAHTEIQTAQDALGAARQQLVRARHQQQLIANHLDDYQALAARGFVGPEARLAWIEAVQLANRDAGLYGLDYRLSPRTAEPSTLARELPLGHTRMTLSLPLLVETDLPRFLSALHTRAPGIVRVQGCRLSQPDSAAPTHADQPRLRAECELHWFTVAPPEPRA